MAFNKEIICWKFGGPKGCPFGDKCIFNHNNKDASVAAFNAEMSRRNNNIPLESTTKNIHELRKCKPCWRFGGPKGCSFGDKCTHSHDDHTASIKAFNTETIRRGLQNLCLQKPFAGSSTPQSLTSVGSDTNISSSTDADDATDAADADAVADVNTNTNTNANANAFEEYYIGDAADDEYYQTPPEPRRERLLRKLGEDLDEELKELKELEELQKLLQKLQQKAAARAAARAE